MALGKVTAIHVLTDWTCNLKHRQAVVPVVRWELTGRIENYVVWNTLTCTVPSSWESSAELVVGRVLKVWFNDNGTADFEEYRITEMVDDVVGGVATLTATGWLTDLVEKYTCNANGNPVSIVCVYGFGGNADKSFDHAG